MRDGDTLKNEGRSNSTRVNASLTFDLENNWRAGGGGCVTLGRQWGQVGGGTVGRGGASRNGVKE